MAADKFCLFSSYNYCPMLLVVVIIEHKHILYNQDSLNYAALQTSRFNNYCRKSIFYGIFI